MHTILHAANQYFIYLFVALHYNVNIFKFNINSMNLHLAKYFQQKFVQFFLVNNASQLNMNHKHNFKIVFLYCSACV